MDRRFMTVAEAAGIYGLSRNTIRALYDDGQIDGFRTEGGHRRLSVESLEDYVNRGDARATEIVASIKW